MVSASRKEKYSRKISHQFPERARTHQLRGISTVSHFLNVGQMCRDVRRRTVEGADPETWYGRVVTSVGRTGQGTGGGCVGRSSEDEGGRSARRRTKEKGRGSSGTENARA